MNTNIRLQNNNYKKCFIFDMDGVIFRHPRAFLRLNEKVNLFVKKSVNMYMDERKASQINSQLYKEFGHTLIGLQKIYNDELKSTDFNNFVYDNDFIGYLERICDEDIVQEDGKNFRDLLINCNNKRIPVYIFSNASNNWCKTILNKIKVLDIINENNIICSDSNIYINENNDDTVNTISNQIFLKPYTNTYVKIMDYIYKNEKYEDDLQLQLIYIDDQMQNLIPVMNNKVWKPILMRTNIAHEKICSNNILTIDNLSELYMLM